MIPVFSMTEQVHKKGSDSFEIDRGLEYTNWRFDRYSFGRGQPRTTALDQAPVLDRKLVLYRVWNPGRGSTINHDVSLEVSWSLCSLAGKWLTASPRKLI